MTTPFARRAVGSKILEMAAPMEGNPAAPTAMQKILLGKGMTESKISNIKLNKHVLDRILDEQKENLYIV